VENGKRMDRGERVKCDKQRAMKGASGKEKSEGKAKKMRGKGLTSKPNFWIHSPHPC